MQKLLVAALSVGLLAGHGTPPQSTPRSIQGVWRVVEATTAGPGARTIAFSERPIRT